MILEDLHERPGCYSVNLLDGQPLTPGPFTAKMLKKITTSSVINYTVTQILLHHMNGEGQAAFWHTIVFLSYLLDKNEWYDDLVVVGACWSGIQCNEVF